MEYREVPQLSRAAIQQGLASDELQVRRDSLLSAAFYDPDWRCAQDICLDILARDEDTLKSLAITCLGHIARIHGAIETERVVPVFAKLGRDRELAPYVSDTVNYDFRMFLDNWPTDAEY